MRYHVDGATVTLPGSIEYIGYEVGVYAENLVIEDGVQQFSRYSTSCDNIVLTLPGTVWLNEASVDASKLEVLNIKKSANADAVPHFDYYCLCHSYNVKAIICEYDIVPTAEKDAFGLESPAERGITITATIYSDGTRRCAKTVR